MNVRKDTQHQLSLGQCKLKYHYTRKAKFKKKLIKPITAKNVKQQEFIIGGNTKWYSHFGRQSKIFLQN